MGAENNLSKDQFERFKIPATEIREGDYLDPRHNVRVHKTHAREGTVSVAWKQRGSKAPGVTQHAADAEVSVWRRKSQP